MHGIAIPASFVITEVAESGTGSDAGTVSDLAGEPGARSVDIDGSRGARLDELVKPDSLMTDLADTTSRRISYVLPAPGVPRWLVVTYSTIGDGDPNGDFAQILVELFDAIMTTFRWLDKHAAV
jgi:hypothetical protein